MRTVASVLLLFLLTHQAAAQVENASGDRPATRQVLEESQVKAAAAVKDRHMDSLFRLPAVVGAGIGASKQHPGKAVIQVYVSRSLTRKERRAFPKALEGVPVEVEVTGPFRALEEGSKAKRPGAATSRKKPEKRPQGPSQQ